MERKSFKASVSRSIVLVLVIAAALQAKGQDRKTPYPTSE